MEITTSTIEKTKLITLVHVRGSIDSSTIEALTERAIAEATACEGQLVLDLGGVTSVEGVALRLLVRLYRAVHPEGGRGVNLAILNAPDKLLRVHKALGLETMVPTLSGALDDVLEAIEAPQSLPQASGRPLTTNANRPAFDVS